MRIYTVTTSKPEKLGPQSELVYNALKGSKTGLSMADIATKIEKAGLKTVQTPKRIASWYLKIFVERGFVQFRDEATKAEPKAKKPAAKRAKTAKTVTAHVEPVAAAA